MSKRRRIRPGDPDRPKRIRLVIQIDQKDFVKFCCFIETIVGVNKYQPETEEKVDVLVIDNTRVRESQV